MDDQSKCIYIVYVQISYLSSLIKQTYITVQGISFYLITLLLNYYHTNLHTFLFKTNRFWPIEYDSHVYSIRGTICRHFFHNIFMNSFFYVFFPRSVTKEKVIRTISLQYTCEFLLVKWQMLLNEMKKKCAYRMELTLCFGNVINMK